MEKIRQTIAEEHISLRLPARFFEDFLRVEKTKKFADTNLEANPCNFSLGELPFLGKVLFTLIAKYSERLKVIELYLEELSKKPSEINQDHVDLVQSEFDEIQELLRSVYKKYNSYLKLIFPALCDPSYIGHNIVKGHKIELLNPEIGKKQ